MSSFFDNTKIVGFAFLVVGFILIIDAILSIVLGFVDVPAETKEGIPNWTIYCVVGGIGSLICAVLYTMFALKVNNGTYSEKIVILEKYVMIVGITTALGSIFSAAALDTSVTDGYCSSIQAIRAEWSGSMWWTTR